MFWISKKTITFKDVWKDGFVDIHNHLLPSIDDGSKSVADTLAMIDGMQSLGITEAIATPHTYPGLWSNTRDTITNAYQLVPQNFITSFSSEYFADHSLLDLLKEESLLPIKDSFLLIEFSMMSPPIAGLMDVLFALKLKGYQLILAHPERYLYWDKNLIPFEELKSFDLEFQLNAMSLLGYYGEKCKKITERLLENDFYDFLGTDFHHVRHVHYTAHHAFSEKYLQKIMALVTANQQFTNK
jgi:tyrosine-protein phosphatase YwqE